MFICLSVCVCVCTSMRLWCGLDVRSVPWPELNQTDPSPPNLAKAGLCTWTFGIHESVDSVNMAWVLKVMDKKMGRLRCLYLLYNHRWFLLSDTEGRSRKCVTLNLSVCVWPLSVPSWAFQAGSKCWRLHVWPLIGPDLPNILPRLNL